VLFLAGILPAIMIGLVDAVYVPVVRAQDRACRRRAATHLGYFESTRDASWALGTAGGHFRGIYGGIFTPTEAAGVAVVYASPSRCSFYKDIGWPEL